MFKYTKGKWVVGDYSDYVDINDENGNLIAHCEWGEGEFQKTPEEYRGNAKLIAAAPEMYELLADILANGGILLDLQYKRNKASSYGTKLYLTKEQHNKLKKFINKVKMEEF